MYPEPQPIVTGKKVATASFFIILLLAIFYFLKEPNFHLLLPSPEEKHRQSTVDLEKHEYIEAARKRRRKLSLEDYIEKEGGIFVLTEARKRKLKKHLENYEEAQTYALVARSDGERECPICFAQYGKTHLYILKGEVLKYGVSLRGSNRYNPAFYKKIDCDYFVVHRGDYTSCLKKEKEFIFHYPILPENLKRKQPLVRPPMNLNDN